VSALLPETPVFTPSVISRLERLVAMRRETRIRHSVLRLWRLFEFVAVHGSCILSRRLSLCSARSHIAHGGSCGKLRIRHLQSGRAEVASS